MSTAHPAPSIVIASAGDHTRLIADLSAARGYCVREQVELIVSRADTPARLAELSAALPGVRIVGAPPATDLQGLRDIGFAAAHGDVVALLDHDDSRLRHEPWPQALRRCCALRYRARSADGTDTGSTRLQPSLSVVVPVYQGAESLHSTLTALAASELPRSRWELIVVDDGSTDESARIAARFADVLVRLPGRAHGTAYARNRGFEFTRGEFVAFIDADVCVRPDTLTRFVAALAADPGVSAVFGTFDACPGVAGLVSRYRSLRLGYYRQISGAETDTFSASCSAVRSSVFASVGMFDEWHFPRHGVEDFELGYRLRERSHRTAMRPDIQVSHLKCWSLKEMIAADLHNRAVPWIRLFDRRATKRTWRNDRLRAVTVINTVLTWLALALVLAAASVRADRPALLAAASVCVGVVLVNLLPQHRFFVRHGGFAFALAAIPLELLSYLLRGVAAAVGRLARHLLGEPRPHPTVEAFAELGVQSWPPVPMRRDDATPQPAPATLNRPA